MPHDSDVHLTPHDRHDTMLVAALAAGDLAAADRDQAIALAISCADCATLRDDLVAIARVTASVPPPHATPARDFRLTPADAARLRPGGWRRLVGAISAPRLAAARPLGVAFTTLGLVGLLIGNAPLNIGAPAGAGSTGSSESAGVRAANDGAQPAASGAAAAAAPPAASAPAASSGSEVSPISAPAASGAAYGNPDAAASGAPDIQGGGPVDTTALGNKASPATRDLATDEATPVPTATADPLRPINLLLLLAVVVGLALLVVSRARVRSRT